MKYKTINVVSKDLQELRLKVMESVVEKLIDCESDLKPHMYDEKLQKMILVAYKRASFIQRQLIVEVQ